MNNKYLLVGLGLLVGLVVAFGYVSVTHRLSLSAVISPSAALDQQFLINDFNSITADLQAIRSPLAGVVQTTTAAIGFPAVASSTAGDTTTTAPGLAAALGDIVLVRPSTSSPGFSFDASVNLASTTSATFDINVHNNTKGAASVAPSSTLFYLTVIPRASFTAPAALVTTTST